MNLVYEELAERRKAAAERQRKHRAKVKEVAKERLAQVEKQHDSEFDERRVRMCLVLPGEVLPCVDADNVPDALEVAREFLVALGQPDVQPGESLLDVERRVFAVWHGRLLNRRTIQLEGAGFEIERCFDDCWVPLPGAYQPIDVTLLPGIEPTAVGTKLNF